jgi:TetR/AcrR family transcriptional regulator, ethionamide resistance regulator
MSSQSDRPELYTTRSGDRPRGHNGTSEAETTILDAAERLLAEVPLHELSVAQIIAEAKISRATFYFYFSSKFAVLTALVARVMDELLDASLAFPITSGQEPAQLLERRVEAATRVWGEHRAVLRATVENWNVFPELRELWLGVMERLTDGIAREIEHERRVGNAPPGPDGRQLAAVLAWSIERCLYVSGLGVHEFMADEKQAVTAITRLWVTAAYGPQAAAG